MEAEQQARVWTRRVAELHEEFLALEQGRRTGSKRTWLLTQELHDANCKVRELEREVEEVRSQVQQLQQKVEEATIGARLSERILSETLEKLKDLERELTQVVRFRASPPPSSSSSWPGEAGSGSE